VNGQGLILINVAGQRYEKGILVDRRLCVLVVNPVGALARATPISARVQSLLATMTLPEKLGQLTMVTAEDAVTGPVVPGDYVAQIRTGGVGSLLNLIGRERTSEIQRIAVEESRLGIPLLFAFDVLHGYRTIFPIPLAEAAAFDPKLWERTARLAAAEAAHDGVALTFAPMLDVSRDPRWGRVAEAPGEDPWLASRFAEAKTRGFQQGDLAAPDSIAATAKHIGAYGAATAGREYASVDVSERLLHEVYLPPFRAAVEAGVAAVMPAFTDLAGVPMSANSDILGDLVRERWGFAGVIISDYAAIAELVAHGVAADLAEAAALALKAGVDLDMMGFAYMRGLPLALERGLVAEHDIDAAVSRVLQLKERLGLLDDPYRVTGRPRLAGCRARRKLARDAARRAIVLLTNRDETLPLTSTLRRLAVIGPLADAPQEMLGPWFANGRAEETVTFLQGLRAALPAAEIEHARGVDIEGNDVSGLAAAIELCRRADAIVLCLGESRAMSGEAASRARPDLPGRQRELAEAVMGLGRPVIAVLSSGRPLIVPWLVERADAVLATWFLGTEAGHALADVLTGAWNPSGRLPVSWPVDVGQVPVFYSQRPSGRPADPKVRYTSKYIDVPVAPLFSFGHGLSYTHFLLGGLCCAPTALRPGDELVVEVDVLNAGARAGEETVLVFVHDVVASVARPVLELKGSSKVVLEPGERATARIVLAAEALKFPGLDLAARAEPGTFEILVGASADQAKLLRQSIRLEGGSLSETRRKSSMTPS
jgi:beta-glucosidase